MAGRGTIDDYSFPPYIGEVLLSSDPVQAFFASGMWSWLNESRYDCVNASAVFGEEIHWVYRLWECAIYLNVTNAFRLGILSETNSSALLKGHVDTSLTKAGMGTSTISSCLSAMCESLEHCKQIKPHVCLPDALTINGSMLNLDPLDTCLVSICASHPYPLANPDIAGIGIVSSYIIQAGTTLLCALALFVLNYLIKRQNRHESSTSSSHIRGVGASQALMSSQNVTSATANQIEADNSEEMRPRETRDQLLLDPQASVGSGPVEELDQQPSNLLRYHDALIAALVEFLKAQCFTAVAVSIAALIVLSNQDSLSLLDVAALGTTSGISIVPTTFTFYILATFNTDPNDPRRKSWYLYTLCLCSWILGIWVILSPEMFKITKENKKSHISFLAHPQHPNACANASPSNLCNRGIQVIVYPEYTFYYLLCIPSMLGLTLWQLSTLRFIRESPLAFLYKPSDKRIYPLFVLLHFFAIGLFVAPFVLFFKGIGDLFYSDLVSFDWNFGQIVALTLWLPSLMGFVYNIKDGVGPAHTKQMPVGYNTKKVS